MSEGLSFFEKNGYISVPHFLPSTQIEEVRREALARISEFDEATLRPSEFLKSENLTGFVFSRRLKEVLNAISLEYRFFIPNFTIRSNLYIDWHSDDEFVESEPQTLPEVLQCNIYLQENSEAYGGGIDLSVGTHRLSKEEKKAAVVRGTVPRTIMSTQAGDLLIFDYRVLHRSTFPREKPVGTPRLAIQWTVCRSVSAAKSFLSYLARRQCQTLHLSDYTKTRAVSYFKDIQKVRFPNSFSEKSMAAVTSNQFQIVTAKAVNE